MSSGPASGRILSMPPLDHYGGGSPGHCEFCRINRGEEAASIVHEDIHSLAFMDIQPVFAGHTLVVSRRHFTDILEVPEDVAVHCMGVARTVAAGIRTTTDAVGVNLFSANGRAGGQDVPHFHIHVIPVPAGAEFPLQLPQREGREAERSDLDAMAEQISLVLGRIREV